MHTIKRTHVEKAYLQGFRAGANGRSDFNCPYKTNMEARGLWVGGWRVGREQFLLGNITNITRH